MGKVTFGKTSWDNPVPSNNGDDFLRINSDGSYAMRIIGAGPMNFAVHWTEDNEGNKRKVKCAAKDCILCKEGVKADVRYLSEVYSLDESAPKIVEFGVQVYKKIQSLSKSKHWGDPRTYNIVIVRDKSAGPSGMYDVQPIGKDPLSAEAQAASAEFTDRVEEVMLKFSSPSSNDEILQKLGRGAGQATGAWSGSATKETPVSAEEDDFDF